MVPATSLGPVALKCNQSPLLNASHVHSVMCIRKSVSIQPLSTFPAIVMQAQVHASVHVPECIDLVSSYALCSILPMSCALVLRPS